MTNMEHTRHPEYQYLDILQDIPPTTATSAWTERRGHPFPVRTHMRFDVSDAFPVLTTRKIYWQSRHQGDAVDALGRKKHSRPANSARIVLDRVAPRDVPPGDRGPDQQKDFERRIIEDRGLCRTLGRPRPRVRPPMAALVEWDDRN